MTTPPEPRTYNITLSRFPSVSGQSLVWDVSLVLICSECDEAIPRGGFPHEMNVAAILPAIERHEEHKHATP